jgi:GNAT superfamily N-acetyltransferase
MADAKITLIGPGEIGLLAELYAMVFTPSVDEAFFRRRFHGRHNVSIFVAIVGEHHVGFAIGYELKPDTYYCWLCGVSPDARRLGVATQLMQAQQAFAFEHGYQMIRFECQNQHRPMLHMAITEGYDLVGIRWDTMSAANVAIFEKDLR